MNEALLLGLLGLRAGVAGEASLAPRLPLGVDRYTFRAIRLRGRTVGVDATASGCIVRVDRRPAWAPLRGTAHLDF